MQISLTQLKQIGVSHLGAVILVLIGIVEIANLAAVVGLQSDNTLSQQPILKISEIRGPRIDDEAAMIVVDETENTLNQTALVIHCFTLPAAVWVFLLIAYVALLVFNFSYTFKEAERPQWFWEMLYALAFIAGWFIWDACRENIWFPFAIAKFGLILFVIYLYFLERKREKTTV
jgi:hypothetical protein